jgi:hypothetical protein
LAFCASQDPRKVPKPAMICYNTLKTCRRATSAMSLAARADGSRTTA